jgi:hypothetical protein
MVSIARPNYMREWHKLRIVGAPSISTDRDITALKYKNPEGIRTLPLYGLTWVEKGENVTRIDRKP